MRCALCIALHSLPLPPGPHFRGKDAVGNAQQVRRSCGASQRRLEGELGTQNEFPREAQKRWKMQIAEEIAATTNNTGMGRPGDPCIMVNFGASGDLTKRKLIPALYNLAK